MDWLTEPFELAFQQRALLAGVLAAVALALVGTWVVIRGMTFLGDALVHGVIPGIALAVMLDFNPLLGAAAAAFVMIAGINYVRSRTAFGDDTGIGLLFVGMLALGVILLSTTPNYSGTLAGILFGDTLGVTAGDVAFLAVIAALTVVAVVLLHRPFLVLAFNEDKARLLGMRPRLAHFALLALVTLVIVGSFRTVGTLLVFGLLVGPPATASLLVRRVPVIMALAAGIGVLSVVAGLVTSYHAGTAGSASIALFAVGSFFVTLIARELATRFRRTVPAS
ncbi:MAG: metal ABC transporter permease [Actinomycetes bacterium]|jgi:ABC-type Mn2+/Zn2+ transport system permease subunit